jgi:hypothetical protein
MLQPVIIVGFPYNIVRIACHLGLFEDHTAIYCGRLIFEGRGPLDSCVADAADFGAPTRFHAWSWGVALESGRLPSLLHVRRAPRRRAKPAEALSDVPRLLNGGNGLRTCWPELSLPWRAGNHEGVIACFEPD